MRRIALVALALLATTAAPRAAELAELLQRAVDRDGQVQVLRMNLENALIASKRADLEPGFSVSLSSGKARLARSEEPRYGDPAQALSLSPGLTVQLASPLGTQVNVSVPTTYDAAAWSRQQTTPTVKITQPLNDLLGIPTDTLADLELRQAVEAARADLAKRVLAVEKDVLTRLRTLSSGESTLGDLAVQIQAARRDLEDARTLGTYAEASASLARLVQSQRSLEHKRDLQAAKQERDLRDLGRLIGGAVDELPASLSAPELVLPPEEAAEANADVGLARRALRLEELRLAEQVGGKTPELSVSGTYSRSIVARFAEELKTTEASVGVGLTFDHLTISAGPGVVEETGTLYFGAEGAWSPPAAKLDRLDRVKQENIVRVKRAEIATAERSYLESRAALEGQILDLRLQAEDLALSRSVAERALAETEAKYGHGLADEQELAEARWALEKVGHDERLLAVDRLLAAIELQGLTTRDKEK